MREELIRSATIDCTQQNYLPSNSTFRDVLRKSSSHTCRCYQPLFLLLPRRRHAFLVFAFDASTRTTSLRRQVKAHFSTHLLRLRRTSLLGNAPPRSSRQRPTRASADDARRQRSSSCSYKTEEDQPPYFGMSPLFDAYFMRYLTLLLLTVAWIRTRPLVSRRRDRYRSRTNDSVSPSEHHSSLPL